MELKIPEWFNVEVKIDQKTFDSIDLRKLPPEQEEKELLQDLFSCLIGGQGQYIHRSNEGKYSNLCIARDSMTNFIEQCLSICDQVYFLQVFSKSHFEFRNGRTMHAYCASLSNFLHDYTENISSLASLQDLTLPLFNNHIKVLGETINAVFLATYNLKDKVGTAISSSLYTFLSSNRGNSTIRGIIFKLFLDSINPLLTFLENWIYKGEIYDSQQEFFIRPRSSTPLMTDSYWETHFEIVTSQLPNFIPKHIIDHAYYAGLARSVLLFCTKQVTAEQLEQFPKFQKLSWDLLKTEGYLGLISQTTQIKLIEILERDHNLSSVLMTIKTILLCQRGDKLHRFLDISGSIMHTLRNNAEPLAFEPFLVNAYGEHVLDYLSPTIEDDQIGSAIAQIHGIKAKKNENSQWVAQIPTRKTRTTFTKGLWEYFALNFRVPQPLNIIITKEAQERYKLLFRHVLLWRRLEFRLHKYWKLPQYMKKKKLSPSLYFVSGGRYIIDNFIETYLHFLSDNGVGAAWDHFEASEKKAKSVEELISSHNEFLRHLMENSFISNFVIFRRLDYIASIISSFITNLKRWRNSVDNEATDTDSAVKLAEPLNTSLKTFISSKEKLIHELDDQAQKEVDPCYSNFIVALGFSSHSVPLYMA